MFSYITKILKTMLHQPFGCLFAMLISTVLCSAAIAGMAFITAAIIAVPIVKETISSQTGFHASAESIFLNIFTGTCEINYLSLENPNAYNVSDVVKDSEIETTSFMEAKKIRLSLSPYRLIFDGIFEIKSAEIDIAVMNCVRINNASYNLPEFLAGISKIVEMPNELQKISVRINRSAYCDVTTINDIMKWNTILNLDFQRTNITDYKRLKDSFVDALNAANAPFIARGIKF